MGGVIAHEWIETHGGAEKVVAAFADAYPDAPIVCSWDDTNGAFAPGRIRESWLARTRLRREKALALPFMLSTWRHIPVREADWLLCSSHLFAHHARLAGSARDVPKYVFAHTPARYIWEPTLDVRGGGPLVRAAAVPLRRIDRSRAQEAYKIAAVSEYIARRIERCWERESTVVFPPVDVTSFADGFADEPEPHELVILDSLPATFLLGASRLVPYKRLDVAIAAGAACDLPVVIAGDGPDGSRLRAIAAESSSPVMFISHPSSALLRELYVRALVYVFAPIEDFGIMPVEAMATGTPVVANAIGGASESVLDGVTGSHLHSTEARELARAVADAAKASPEACRRRARDFDGNTFASRIKDWMS